LNLDAPKPDAEKEMAETPLEAPTEPSKLCEETKQAPKQAAIDPNEAIIALPVAKPTEPRTEEVKPPEKQAPPAKEKTAVIFSNKATEEREKDGAAHGDDWDGPPQEQSYTKQRALHQPDQYTNNNENPEQAYYTQQPYEQNYDSQPYKKYSESHQSPQKHYNVPRPAPSPPKYNDHAPGYNESAFDEQYYGKESGYNEPSRVEYDEPQKEYREEALQDEDALEAYQTKINEQNLRSMPYENEGNFQQQQPQQDYFDSDFEAPPPQSKIPPPQPYPEPPSEAVIVWNLTTGNRNFAPLFEIWGKNQTPADFRKAEHRRLKRIAPELYLTSLSSPSSKIKRVVAEFLKEYQKKVKHTVLNQILERATNKVMKGYRDTQAKKPNLKVEVFLNPHSRSKIKELVKKYVHKLYSNDVKWEWTWVKWR